ncbi:MAG TPA: response regulator, partial [Candidatus Cloacimonadota bacterium]|nr:response regulator [Candidatus Cloacimonadota bacterium]
MADKEVEILLVEDNPNDVRLTIRALGKHNLANKIHHVADGEEALDFIFGRNKYIDRNTNNIPRLILLDLKLPKVDGLEVLKILKGDERTRAIPIVVLTSSNQEMDIVKSYNLGANSYIVKPVDFDQFLKSVSDLG